MRPSSCWRCRLAFDEDAAFELRVFGMLRESGPEAAREMVDEHYADEHATHEESWV